MIDTGYSDTLFLLINSIYKLGFTPYDIKYIIHTHWYGDHTEATAALVHLTGAKTFIGENDVESVSKYFQPDVLLKNGDVVKLGNTEIEVLETPGHTRGCISLFFETGENRFIDGNIWHEFLDFCEKRLDEVIQRENTLQN